MYKTEYLKGATLHRSSSTRPIIEMIGDISFWFFGIIRAIRRKIAKNYRPTLSPRTFQMCLLGVRPERRMFLQDKE